MQTTCNRWNGHPCICCFSRTGRFRRSTWANRKSCNWKTPWEECMANMKCTNCVRMGQKKHPPLIFENRFQSFIPNSIGHWRMRCVGVLYVELPRDHDEIFTCTSFSTTKSPKRFSKRCPKRGLNNHFCSKPGRSTGKTTYPHFFHMGPFGLLDRTFVYPL